MKTTRTLPTTLALLAALLLAASAAPADTGPAKAPEQPTEAHGETTKPEAKALLETVKLVQMIDEVGLDRETALAVYPLVKELDELHGNYWDRRAEIIERLRGELGKVNPDPRTLSGLQAQLDALRLDLLQKDQRLQEQIRSALTVVQAARLTVFLDDFQKQLRKGIGRVRGQKASE